MCICSYCFIVYTQAYEHFSVVKGERCRKYKYKSDTSVYYEKLQSNVECWTWGQRSGLLVNVEDGHKKAKCDLELEVRLCGQRTTPLVASQIPNIRKICLGAVSVDHSVFPTGWEFIKGGRHRGEVSVGVGEYQEVAGRQRWILKINNYCTWMQHSDRLGESLWAEP